MELLGKTRSTNNGLLTLEFLWEYSAAVQVDLKHALSRLVLAEDKAKERTLHSRMIHTLVTISANHKNLASRLTVAEVVTEKW